MTASQFPHPLQPSASCVCHSLNWQTQGISFQFLLSLNSQLKLLTTPFFPKLFLFLASPSYLCYSSYFSPSKIPLKGWSSMFLCSRPSSLLSLHILLGWLSTTPGPIFSGLFLHVHLQLSKLLELHTHSRHLTASRTCLLDILGCLTFNTWQMELFSLTPLASTSKIPCYEKSLFYLSFKPHNGEYSLIIPSLTFFFSSNSLVTRFSGFHFAWIHNHVCSFLAVCESHLPFGAGVWRCCLLTWSLVKKGFKCLESIEMGSRMLEDTRFPHQAEGGMITLVVGPKECC